MYIEVSLFQGVGIEGFHCIQRCPYLFQGVGIERLQRCPYFRVLE